MIKLQTSLHWPGCAQGKYTIKAKGFILAILCWGNSGGPLENWGPFAYVPIDPATIVACFGAVWVMYGKLCGALGITLSDKILKLLARAALANIAANLGSVLIAMIAGMMFPGASIVASAITAFVTVYLAGMIFLELILNLAMQSKDPYSFSDISAKEFKKGVENTKVGKEDLEAAKKAFEESK